MTRSLTTLALVFLLATASVAAERPAQGVTARQHMVAAAHPLAAEAGRTILRRGGNAIDAAIATALVLNIVEPQSAGIGGGAFLVFYDAASRAVRTYDGRETAPAGATPDMFLDANGEPIRFADAIIGGRSVGVPGLLRLFAEAHRRHGALPWYALFEPAISAAEEGFAVPPRLAAAIVREDRALRVFRESREHFYRNDGTPRQQGEWLRNPALAETLRDVARQGIDVFYDGPLAHTMVEAIRTSNPSPGRMTVGDLGAYQIREREPVCGTYRKRTVCGMGPPSSGGITALQILTKLGRFDMARRDPQSIETLHLFAEASRLAYADRDVFIADPAFVDVPTGGLLNETYLRRRSRLIDLKKAARRAEPGEPPFRRQAAAPVDDTDEANGTTHLSVVDRNGNAVAMTASIESAFGSRLMVRGFLLNNHMTDFAFRPRRDGQLAVNRVEPGKRPRSSMAPTIVLDERDRLEMVIGSPGGPRIIAYVAQTLMGVVDWRLGIQEAIDLPHIVNRNGETEIEAGTSLVAHQEPLKAMGHRVSVEELNSGLHGIIVTARGLRGGADRRRDGVALGD
ncbi:MAG: gamma-glutamyltransferase [Alphaproteobacteria bacterium]|nr:gamma-glutamyltransferase [Alphaproteobacteria bacterium]